ncbi:hypothetical protein BJF90_20925 [Pseudonocardia sp. CNS-004]|nr:hypothetical protein BJF90_20925 [Pseudonocardia sp. CNS-004]
MGSVSASTNAAAIGESGRAAARTTAIVRWAGGSSSTTWRTPANPISGSTRPGTTDTPRSAATRPATAAMLRAATTCRGTTPAAANEASTCWRMLVVRSNAMNSSPASSPHASTSRSANRCPGGTTQQNRSVATGVTARSSSGSGVCDTTVTARSTAALRTRSMTSSDSASSIESCTCGWSARNVDTTPGSRIAASEGSVAMRTRPVRPAR